MTQALAHPDPLRRIRVVRAPAAAALVVMLSDPDPRVLSTVVHALGQLGDPVATTRLAALLGDPRVAAAHLVDALSRMGGSAVESLAPVLDNPSVPARVAALETLGRIGAVYAGQDVRVADLIGPAGRRGLDRALQVPDLAPLARRLLDLHPT